MEINRFIRAYKVNIDTVKLELKKGKKQSHWIWFIFPQLKGLGFSLFSDYYGLEGPEEAELFYKNGYLRRNMNGLLRIVSSYSDFNYLQKCLGDLDTKKFHACLTIFYLATNKAVFKKLLDKFFNGLLNKDTMLLLKRGD